MTNSNSYGIFGLRGNSHAGILASPVGVIINSEPTMPAASENECGIFMGERLRGYLRVCRKLFPLVHFRFATCKLLAHPILASRRSSLTTELGMTSKQHPHTPQKYDRTAIMRRAWELFRKTYSYPSVSIARIGWHCFGDCVRNAWVEAKKARALTMLSRTEIQDRIAACKHSIRGLVDLPLGMSYAPREQELRAQIFYLQGGLT